MANRYIRNFTEIGRSYILARIYIGIDILAHLLTTYLTFHECRCGRAVSTYRSSQRLRKYGENDKRESSHLRGSPRARHHLRENWRRESIKRRQQVNRIPGEVRAWTKTNRHKAKDYIGQNK